MTNQIPVETMKDLMITLVKSRFGRTPRQRACIKALGLSRIGQQVIRPASPETLGLIRVVGFVLKVTEVVS